MCSVSSRTRALALPEADAGSVPLERVGHRLPEPPHAVLRDVVGRAPLHDLHRALLADGPRDDDEGDVEPALLHDLEGAHRVEPGHA